MVFLELRRHCATRISGSLSCGAREVRSPCAWGGGAPSHRLPLPPSLQWLKDPGPRTEERTLCCDVAASARTIPYSLHRPDSRSSQRRSGAVCSGPGPAGWSVASPGCPGSRASAPTARDPGNIEGPGRLCRGRPSERPWISQGRGCGLCALLWVLGLGRPDMGVLGGGHTGQSGAWDGPWSPSLSGVELRTGS